MKTQRTSRVVADLVGDGGSVRLDEELVARTGWTRSMTLMRTARRGSWTR